MNYLLSVIIPTKDRYVYLKECVETLLDLKSDKVEIVIQDNTTDNAEFLDYLSTIDCSHIRYNHSTEALSQTGNSDLAVSYATGDYCCYIGDDDSISQAAIDATQYLKNNDLQACVCNVATYHWPDVVFEKDPKPALSFDDREIEIRTLNSTTILNKVLGWGLQDIKYLPRIYHGIISREILEQIKNKTGTFFPGPSPDMANAVASTLLIEKYVYIRLPLIISGYSYKSGGGMGLRGAHKGDIKDIKTLPANVAENWTPYIPQIWLGYTIWPESGIKALQAMGREEYIKSFNVNAMYAKTYLRYPEYRKLTRKYVRGISSSILFGYECARFMRRWASQRLDLSKRIKSGNQFIENEKISLTETCKIVNLHNQKNANNHLKV